MFRIFLLLIVFAITLCVTNCQDVDVYPAIAMYCGKNTQHRNIASGGWESDPSGNKDCIGDVAEMLQYCREVYPDLTITNVAREANHIRIPAWCALGHHGLKCKGHGHSVVPVRCITAEHTPTLVAKTGCTTMTISDESLCKGGSYWAAKAADRCQEEGKQLYKDHQSIMPCNGVAKFNGIQFACCKNAKPEPKVYNLDPACTQPMKSGLCRAAFEAWYFNTETGSCTHFIYGGCGGNDNRFNSEQECRDACEVKVLIKDPLLDMGVGPVMPESAPTAETTTTATLEQSSDSYFEAPLDPHSEQELFSNALKNELKEHQGKLSSLMGEWNSAKVGLMKHGGSKQKGDQVDSDLQKEVAALQNEHQRKRSQISSAHQARVDASIVGARTSSYNDFMNELNKDDVQPSNLLRAFRRYLQAEVKDQHHTTRLLQRATDQDPDQVPVLQTKLTTIQDRVNNALETAQQKLGSGETSSSMAQLVSDMMTPTAIETPQTDPEMPNILHDDVMGDVEQPMEDERPRLIDYGGLPPENVDNREDFFSDSDDDESMYEDEDIDPEFSKETPAPLFPSDFMENEDTEDIMDNMDDIDFEPEPLPRRVHDYVHSYNEHWLVWLGVGGACLLVIVVVIATVRAVGVRHNQKRQFARVEVEDHLTPEERQLLQMQQSGYENPTYKFFEKQQQA